MKRRTRSEVLTSLPHGIVRVLGRIIELRVGDTNAISKGEIIALLAQHGFSLNDERQIRAGVRELRQAGAPILSSSGARGYWWAKDRAEIELFLDRELRPRATDLFTTISALEKAASRDFGPRGEADNQPLLLDLPRAKQSRDASAGNGFG